VINKLYKDDITAWEETTSIKFWFNILNVGMQLWLSCRMSSTSNIATAVFVILQQYLNNIVSKELDDVKVMLMVKSIMLEIIRSVL